MFEVAIRKALERIARLVGQVPEAPRADAKRIRHHDRAQVLHLLDEGGVIHHAASDEQSDLSI